MSILAATSPRSTRVVSDLASEHPDIEVRPSSATTVEYLDDAATRLAPRRSRTPFGPTVALPTTTEQVQQLVRIAAAHGVADRAARRGQRAVGRRVRDRRPARHLDRAAQPHHRGLAARRGRRRRARRPQRRTQRAPRAASACSTRPTRRAARSRPSAATSPPTPAGCGARSTASPGSRCWRSTSSSPTAASSRSATGRSRASRACDLVSLFVGSEGILGHRGPGHGAAPPDPGGPRTRHGVLRQRPRTARRRSPPSPRSPRAPARRRVLRRRPPSTTSTRPARRRPARARRVAAADRARRLRHRRAGRRTAGRTDGGRRAGAGRAGRRRARALGAAPRRPRVRPRTHGSRASDIAVPKSRMPEVYAHFPETRGALRRRGRARSRMPATATCIRSSPWTIPPATDRSPPAALARGGRRAGALALALGGTVSRRARHRHRQARLGRARAVGTQP